MASGFSSFTALGFSGFRVLWPSGSEGFTAVGFLSFRVLGL